MLSISSAGEVAISLIAWCTPVFSVLDLYAPRLLAGAGKSPAKWHLLHLHCHTKHVIKMCDAQWFTDATARADIGTNILFTLILRKPLVSGLPSGSFPQFASLYRAAATSITVVICVTGSANKAAWATLNWFPE